MAVPQGKTLYSVGGSVTAKVLVEEVEDNLPMEICINN